MGGGKRTTKTKKAQELMEIHGHRHREIYIYIKIVKTLTLVSQFFDFRSHFIP